MILNFCKIEDLVYKHRQVEFKDGLLFMRAKKRPKIIVKAA